MSDWVGGFRGMWSGLRRNGLCVRWVWRVLINWCLGLDLFACVRQSGVGGTRVVRMRLYMCVTGGKKKKMFHENEKRENACWSFFFFYLSHFRPIFLCAFRHCFRILFSYQLFRDKVAFIVRYRSALWVINDHLMLCIFLLVQYFAATDQVH
jgi:hypothetical protein